MIHTIIVTPELSAAELRKIARKRLMTGGAVVRLPDELTESDQQRILTEFSAEAKPNSLASQVLVQLAKHPFLAPSIRNALEVVSLPEVTRSLVKSG